EGDAATYHCQIHPATEFNAAATSLLDGWKKFGFDRSIRMMGTDLPAEAVFSMTAMEYLTHGWDLATATGQPIPYTAQEAKETLKRAVANLPPQYRGEDKPFANIVEVADSAPAIDRLVGFMGRQP
ncbi:MAG: TIGR03086 family metal-binding protein, partial [Ilumatobacteraceae bacterium]